MTRKCLVECNMKKERMVKKYASKRKALNDIICNTELPPEERMEAVMKLAKLPRNSSRVRLHTRCEITGRPRGVYRKFKLCRIKLREMANNGQIPGMLKSSW